MKKILLTIMTVVTVALNVLAASSWVKISDPDCDACVMNDLDRKCGKCASVGRSGFMAQVDGTGKIIAGNYIQYDYKCNKCGHTITYKSK